MPKKVPKSWVFSRSQKFPKCLRNRICNNIATKSLRYGINLIILVRYDNVYTCRVFCWYTGYIIPRFGPNWAQNGPKMAQNCYFSYITGQNCAKVIQIWSDMLFSMGNPLVMSIFVILEYWTPFEAP